MFWRRKQKECFWPSFFSKLRPAFFMFSLVFHNFFIFLFFAKVFCQRNQSESLLFETFDLLLRVTRTICPWHCNKINKPQNLRNFLRFLNWLSSRPMKRSVKSKTNSSESVTMKTRDRFIDNCCGNRVRTESASAAFGCSRNAAENETSPFNFAFSVLCSK